MKPNRWLGLGIIGSLGLAGPEVKVFFIGFKYDDALWGYLLPDGRYYEEFVQVFIKAIPAALIALQDGEGRVVQESLWSDEAIKLTEQICRSWR